MDVVCLVVKIRTEFASDFTCSKFVNGSGMASILAQFLSDQFEEVFFLELECEGWFHPQKPVMSSLFQVNWSVRCFF